jgi:hypothetical protein
MAALLPKREAEALRKVPCQQEGDEPHIGWPHGCPCFRCRALARYDEAQKEGE